MIRPFELHRPTTIVDGVALLAALPDAAVYRGGTELLQVMKMGFARFAHLIDLKRIPELDGIALAEDGSIRIGAAATHAAIGRSPIVRRAYPAFAALERTVANSRVRNVGSIGGNLCFAEPHSDPATFLLAADARLELLGPSGTRALPIDEFVVDALTTTREPAELLVAVVLPPLAHGSVISYRRIAFVERPAASVACRLTKRDGRIVDARIAVGSVGPRPTLVGDAAIRLVGGALSGIGAVARSATADIGDSCDIEDEPGASAEYVRHLVSVLAHRAVVDAAGEFHAD